MFDALWLNLYYSKSRKSKLIYITRIFYHRSNRLNYRKILCCKELKRKVTTMSRKIIRKLNCLGFKKASEFNLVMDEIETVILRLACFTVLNPVLGPSKTGFQARTLMSLCDWLTIIKLQSDWLRAPSSKHQFWNPS